ncbi:MAG: MmgE/PrpD family protein [Nitrospinota bacterium]
MSSATLELAERVASLRLESVPPRVLGHARLCILDALGAALRGSREPSARLVQALAGKEGGAPLAAVWGLPFKTGSLQAALLNGVSAHALDFDDTHQSVPVHATATVLPAAFAAAELTGGTLGDLLAGYTAGAETAIRAGLALGRSHVRRGWHPTGTVGTLGAAAGAARVLGLAPGRIAQALGLAATQAAGFMKAVTGNMAKPLNAGKAAMNGLLAALLARDGFTGPADIAAIDSDFATAFSEGFEPARLAFGGDHGWEIPNTAIKLFACCSLAQAALEGGQAIRREHRLEDRLIAEVEVGANPRQMQIAGIPRPCSGAEGKFSLAYCAVLGLRGAAGGPGDFEDESLRSPAVAALMERVSVSADPALSEVSARLRVRTLEGRTLEKFVAIARGNPGNPASPGEVKGKFLSLAEPVLGGGAEQLLPLVLEGASVRLHVKELADRLAGPALQE